MLKQAEIAELVKEIESLKYGIFCHSSLVGEKDIELHVHSEAWHLMYPTGKNISVNYILDGKTKTLLVPANHFIWMPPGIHHNIVAISDDFMLTSIYYTEVPDDPFYYEIGVFAANRILVDLFKMVKDWNTKIHLEDKKKYPILTCILSLISDNSNREFKIKLPFTTHYQLNSILDYINERLNDSIEISDICRQFGLSERSILSLFQKELGTSYSNHLKTIRVIKSIELLTTTDKRINEIAYLVGYSSFPTFCNTFKNLVGTNPKNYKESLLNQ